MTFGWFTPSAAVTRARRGTTTISTRRRSCSNEAKRVAGGAGGSRTYFHDSSNFERTLNNVQAAPRVGVGVQYDCHSNTGETATCDTVTA
jgi:hypothetical protein